MDDIRSVTLGVRLPTQRDRALLVDLHLRLQVLYTRQEVWLDPPFAHTESGSSRRGPINNSHLSMSKLQLNYMYVALQEG